MFAEVVDGGLGAFGHALHEFLGADVPLVELARGGVYPGLAHTAVGAADADIFVAATKTALGMPLEVGEDHQAVVVLDMAAHAHPGEPFAPSHGQRDGVFLVEDVDRCEGPSVYFQRLAVLTGGVTVALVVGVGLDDVGTF